MMEGQQREEVVCVCVCVRVGGCESEWFQRTGEWAVRLSERP